MKDTIKAISDGIELLCKFIGGFAVFSFVCVISLQVILRNMLRIPLIWANDISVVFFVWAVFFGSAIAVRHRKHFVLEFVPEKYKKINCVLDIIGTLSGFVFFSFLVIYGYDFTIMGLRRLSTSLNIPQAYFFACIPISGIFMLWFNTGIFISDVKRLITLCKGGEHNE